MDNNTGETFTSYYDILTVGAGYLDLNAALGSINEVPQRLRALSPSADYSETDGTVVVSFDPASVFAQTSGYGTAPSLCGASSTSAESTVIKGVRALGPGQHALSTEAASRRSYWVRRLPPRE
ncbi:MAG: hypothetical protein ACJ74Y_06965 [Bryobacteraceae bacterium]